MGSIILHDILPLTESQSELVRDSSDCSTLHNSLVTLAVLVGREKTNRAWTA